MRRLTLRKLASDRAACAGGTPTWRAAAIAASAFMRLCSPCTCHSTTPDALAVAIDGETLVDRHAVCRRQRLPAALHAEALHLAPAAARQHALERGFAAVRRPRGRCPARCAPDDGTGFRSRRDRGKCRRDRIRGCSGPRCAAGSGRTSSACRRRRCRTRRLRSRRSSNRSSRAEMPKFSGTPPIRKPGLRPASSSIQASIELVVVLPCVPATASTHLPCSTCSPSHCGPET